MSVLYQYFPDLVNFPLVLSGPILRTFTFTTVSVFLALRKPCTVSIGVMNLKFNKKYYANQ